MLNIGGKQQIFPTQPRKCTGQSVAEERKQCENVAMTVLTSRNGTDHPLEPALQCQWAMCGRVQGCVLQVSKGHPVACGGVCEI